MWKFVSGLLGLNKPVHIQEQVEQEEPITLRPVLVRQEPEQAQIKPDFSSVEGVEPCLKRQYKATQKPFPFLFEDRFCVITETGVDIFSNTGELLLELPLDIKEARPKRVIDADRVLMQSGHQHYIWTISKNTWVPVNGLAGVTAFAWVGEQLVAFLDEDMSSHHSENYYTLEVLWLVNEADWTLQKIADQTMGGRLEEGRRSYGGDATTSARHGPAGQLSYRSRAILGQRGQPCDPAEGYGDWFQVGEEKQIGAPHHHWKAYPSHSEEGLEVSSGLGRQGRCFVACQNGDDSIVLYWNDPRLQPLPCAQCEGTVSLKETHCQCGALAPETGIQSADEFPGQLRFCSDFEQRVKQPEAMTVKADGDEVGIYTRGAEGGAPLVQVEMRTSGLKGTFLSDDGAKLILVFTGVLYESSRILVYSLDPTKKNNRPLTYNVLEVMSGVENPPQLSFEIYEARLAGNSLILQGISAELEIKLSEDELELEELVD